MFARHAQEQDVSGSVECGIGGQFVSSYGQNIPYPVGMQDVR
jgi:hypothetical protein